MTRLEQQRRTWTPWPSRWRAAIYFVVAATWILVSSSLAATTDRGATFELLKGLAFVLVTSLLLYLLISRYERHVRGTARRLRDLIESAGDVAYRIRLRPTVRVDYISDGVHDLVGLTPDDLYSTPDLGVRVAHPEDRQRLRALMGGPQDAERIRTRWFKPDGSILHTEHDVRPVHDRRGRVVAIEGRLRDVTDSRRDVAAAAVGDSILGWLEEGTDRVAITRRTCERLVEVMEVEVAWAGIPLEDGTVAPIASAGDDRDPDELEARWDEGPLGDGPAGVAIRERRAVRMNPRAPGSARWGQRATAAGFTSSLAVPIVWRGAVRGVLTLDSRFGGPFDDRQVARFETIASRLAHVLSQTEDLPSSVSVASATVSRVRAGDTPAVDLRAAMAEGRIEPWWQPQIACSDGRIVAVEALVRLRDADGRILAPSVVLPLAEETGLMNELGRTLRHRALRESLNWLGNGLERVSLNVSVAEILQPGFVTELDDLLRDMGIAHDQVELEIVETAALEGSAARVITELKHLGVRIAIDDYGSGWASLGHLAHLPADTLKIDRVFIRELGQSERIDTLVASTIDLGRVLRLTTVAEGVETQQQADLLRAMGCDLLQGYLFSAPIETAAMTTMRAAPPWLSPATHPQPGPQEFTALTAT
ncbi:EAL domain-containing protein [Rhabdothermincola salaria]|uniref:EAL domain-containing protein n=1 Tax=Rhabdothermincola salaria TaxID=2903142 RepID=UPI001E3C6A55|nr:EAL domain-containing protein [Rhabdothermincola salaria]